ncbi:MAG: DUF2007 domain-containing protein [Acidobacteriota bacterium]|nr:DUF2007 domain-containing protein [Acidobacteriota bacterium]
MADVWWCPKCGEKFRWSVTDCPDCKVPLVDQRPGPAPTPDAELVLVFSTTDIGLCGIAKSLLEGESIEYLERGERLQYLFGWGGLEGGYNPVIGPVEFWVCADEADRARACLEGLEHAVPEDIVLPDDDPIQESGGESA